MSQAITALAVGHAARFGAQIPQASPGLEISKRGDLSSSSARAAYVHSKRHPLICKRPLYAVNKQCSFVAFAMQSDKMQNGNHRMMANEQEKINHKNMNVTKSHKQTEMKDSVEHLKEILASFRMGSNGRKEMEKKMNRKYINGKHYNQNDMQDGWELIQPEIQESFPEDSHYPKVRHKSKHSSTDASTLREIVVQDSFPEDSNYPEVRHKSKPSSTDALTLSEIAALFKKAKSKPEEGSHGEGQRFQMSDAKAEGPVNTILRVLETDDESGSEKFASSSRNGKSRTRFSRGKFSQSVVLESNSIQKSSLTNKLGYKRPPSNLWRKSPIVAPADKQQEQVVSANSQSGDTEVEDYSLNVGHGNKAQLESDMEYAALDYDDLLMHGNKEQLESDMEYAAAEYDDLLMHGNKAQLESDMEYAAPDYDDLLMPDTSSITALNTIKSKSLINGTPVELSDTSSNSSVEMRDSESLINGAAAEHPSLLTEQKDFSTLKLSELKIIAKSRGLKGFSKVKKAELLELLRQGTN